jgi:tetratricopeptide (TPR) repeat protein
VALLALGATATTLGNGFTLDANVDITGNPHVTEPGGLGDLLTEDFTIGGGLTSGYYRPVVSLVYWVTWRLGGGEPALFYLWSILLHLTVSVGAYYLARRLGAPSLAAAAGASLFAVHPVHAEVTAGVVGLKDLLASAAAVACLLLLLAAREAGTRQARRGLTAAGWAVFLVGILSKEIVAVVLPVLLALDLLSWRGGGEKHGPGQGRAYLVGQYAGLVGVVLLKLSLQHLFIGGTLEVLPLDPRDNPLILLSSPARVLQAIGLLPLYLRLLLWPSEFSPDYSYEGLPLADSLLAPSILLGAALLLAALAGLVLAWRSRNRVLLVALVLALASYLPVSNLLFPISSNAAERFLYLPSLGFCLLCGWLLDRLVSERRVVVAALVVVAVAGLVRINLRNAEWKSNYSLWTAAAVTQPRNLKANLNAIKEHVGRHELDRALLLAERLQGMTARSSRTAPVLEMYRSDILGAHGSVLSEAGRLDEALPFLRRAVELAPESALLKANLAQLHSRRGEHDESLAQWNAALALGPMGPLKARIEGGRERALVALGRGGEAAGAGDSGSGQAPAAGGTGSAEITAARRLVAERPDDPLAYFRLSDLLYRNGETAEAIEVLDALLERRPAEIQAKMNRGILLSQSGRLEEAEAEFRSLMALQPGRGVHAYNLGLVLRRMSRIVEARAAFEKALAALPAGDPLRTQVQRQLAELGL